MTAQAEPGTRVRDSVRDDSVTMEAIYEHDARILPLLAGHLPHSISLLRRIQHGLAHPTPTAKILATFPPGTHPPDDAPWLAARVDLFRGRETQMIVYSSLEAHTSNKPITIAAGSDSKFPANTSYIVSTFDAPQSVLDGHRHQLVSLLAYIKTNLLPTYLASLPVSVSASAEKEESKLEIAHNGSDPDPDPESNPGSTSTKEISKSVTLIPAPSPHAFLLGSLHTALFSLLQRSGSAVFAASKAAVDGSSADPVPGLRVHRFDDPPYAKFFFRRAGFSLSQGTALPTGYRFHDRLGRVGVLESQLDLVQSRTHIPRPRDQLRLIPGSALYVDVDQQGEGEGEEEEMPIAWAFLGVDGALATLHVEPEHRGKGLALALSKETMRRGLASDGVFGSAGIDVDESMAAEVEGWVHTEVAQYNVASRRVMEKIGGEVLSTVTWTVIEVCD